MSKDNVPSMPSDAFEAIEQLARDLQLPKGFYRKLYKDDDWSFIIKIHSLMEAAISRLLLETLGQKELYDVVSRLELSNRTTGKMAFVKAMDLLDEDYRRFIHKLSEIRNDFVHDVSNVAINLRDYLGKPGRLEAATKAFCLGVERVEFDERKLSNIEYMRENPKHVIWMGSVVCLAVAYMKGLRAVQHRELKKVRDHKIGQLEGLEMALKKLRIAIPESKKKSDE